MKALIDSLHQTDAVDHVMQSIVDLVRGGLEDDDDIAYLAQVLGRSGKVLSIRSSEPIADLASTGGPTSLSTLLGPLYLRAMGCCVPKLGVPGRPAGGVDVLAQIPGYRVNLSAPEVQVCIDQCGYAHFVADAEHAPMDARFFRFRQRSGAQNLPALAIASLLAKKIAVGLERAGLDVRVASHGNFGGIWEEARKNAQRFSDIATKVGIKAVCFLTDARFPYQPFVGRGESLVALQEIFDGAGSCSIRDHAAMCLAMAVSISGVCIGDPDAIAAEARSQFGRNLMAQGSSVDAFEALVHQVRAAHRFEVRARGNGFLAADIGRLRDLMVKLQSMGAPTGSAYPDNIGVIFHKMPGELVRSGDTLATIRVPEDLWESVEIELATILLVVENLKCTLRFEKVGDG